MPSLNSPVRRRRERRSLHIERLEDRLVLSVTTGIVEHHAANANASSQAPAPYIANEILVRFSGDVAASYRGAGSAAASVKAQALLDKLDTGESGFSMQWLTDGSVAVGPSARVSVPDDWRAIDAAAALSRMEGVAYAEPNYIVSIAAIPNDSQFNSLWGLHNTGQTFGAADADIDAPETWDLHTGSHDVVVGVIDTGIDYRHEDLYLNVWINQGEIPSGLKSALTDVDGDNLFTFVDLNNAANASHVSDLNNNGYIDAGDLLSDPNWENGADDDGNLYVDDLVGWDFVNNDNDPFDDHSHGTHVSGTIGASANNNVGVVGVNWDVSLMGLKFLSGQGSGSTSDAILAVQYATAMGANLTSNSWGGGGFSQSLFDAIAAAGDAGKLFVAAAGNSAVNNDAAPHYPSNYDLENVIAVAATDHNDVYASFTNYGATSVDLAAPGVSTLSTTPDNGYSSFSGTSMATPHVAGAAALLWAAQPNLTASQVKQAILGGVDTLPADPSGRSTLTNGRLNLFTSLSNILDDDTTPPSPVSDLTVSATTMTKATLTWTATGDDGIDGTAFGYDVRYSTAPITEANWAAATPALAEPSPQPSGSTETFTVSGLETATTYYFALKVRDNVGNESLLSNVAQHTTQAGTPLFADDMENGVNGWTVEGSFALWHQSNHRWSSSDTAWYYGQEGVWNYNALSGGQPVANYGNLISPVIDLSSVDEAMLVFDEWSQVEADTQYDRTRVQISKDGVNWTYLFESHGTNNVWETRTIDISNFTGGDVQLLFDFDTIDAAFNDFEGWYIDNVQILVPGDPPPNTPGVTVTPTLGLQTTEAGGSDSFSVVLDSQPTHDVTIGIASSDTSEGTVDKSSLTFTTSNWDLAQTVTVTGENDPDLDGDVGYMIEVQAASSLDSDYNGLNPADVSVTNLDDEVEVSPLLLEVGIVTASTETWTTVNLANDYGTEMVIVATPNYDVASDPVVTRIQNATGNSFDIKLNRTVGSGAVTVPVHWLAVKEGTYDQATHGVTLEAHKYTSTVTDGKTDGKGSWIAESRAYSNSYAQPVVLAQVMSYADANWSAAWTRSDSSQTNPPNGTLRVGKHRGEDPNTVRANETVGYVVIEASSGTLAGMNYQSAVGSDIVRGVGAAPPYTYSTSLSNPTIAIATLAAMDGGDGGWAVLYGNNAVSPGGVQLAIDEDQAGDGERNHTTEQVAYVVFESPVPSPPVIDLNGADGTGNDFTAAFTEDGAAAVIADTDATLTDEDSSQLSSLVVTITNLLDGTDETLDANTSGTSIVASYSNGVLTLSGADTVANYQSVLRSVAYSNASQDPNTTTRSITFVASDGGNNSNTATTMVSINAVNDNPVLNNNTGLTLDEGVTATIAQSMLEATDVDNTPAELTYTVAAAPANGALLKNGSATSSFTQSDINQGLVSYRHDGSETTSDSFAFAVSDGSGGSIANTTFNIAINSVNDAPINTVPGTQQTDVDTPVVFSAANNNAISISDADAGSNAVRVTLTATNGTITLSGTSGLDFSSGDGTADGSMTFTGTIASINTALNGLRFDPTPGFSGTASLQIVTNDLGASGSGGAKSDTDSVIINVNAPAPANPFLVTGTVYAVSDEWITVTLSRSYDSMVVVATPNYDVTSVPMVTRIRNAQGNSFDLRVARADGNPAPLTDVADVQYLVVEEGVYTFDEHGITMEAVKFNSTRTDRSGSWVGQQATYANSYFSPVVVGQVMTANDPDWSVFWARGSSRGSIPSASQLFVGKHVAQDSDTTRTDETLGYIVIEQGYYAIDSTMISAFVGYDTIRGVGDSPPYTYSDAIPIPANTAVLSSAGMDGGDGGWPVLYGSSPVHSNNFSYTINLAVDEDQIKDTERRHTTEQVAYIALGSMPSSSAAPAQDPIDVDSLVSANSNRVAAALVTDQINVSASYDSLRFNGRTSSFHTPLPNSTKSSSPNTSASRAGRFDLFFAALSESELSTRNNGRSGGDLSHVTPIEAALLDQLARSLAR